MYISAAIRLANGTLLASQVTEAICTGIEGNPDLAGIGVRLAFYIQNAINTLLVIFSPRDSVPSAWAGTVLTASLVIAAIIQKIKHTITLHHATLIMNFATLTCINSLAVAPMLPVWRLRPNEYYARELERDALSDQTGEQNNIFESPFYINKHKRHIKKAQNRERVVLSLALLIQVVLQWTWGIILFVSPVYYQTECNGDTVLVFFLRPFRTRDVRGATFAVWPLWLLFSLGITLVLTIVLALSSPSRAHDMLSRRSTLSLSTGNSSNTPILRQLAHLTREAIPSWRDRDQLLIFFGYVVSFSLWCLLLATSEWQRVLNHIPDEDGENDIAGFGQVTAIFLSLAPSWSLCVALYKYPALRRRQKRRQQRMVANMSTSERERSSQGPHDNPVLRAPERRSPSGSAESFELDDVSPSGSDPEVGRPRQWVAVTAPQTSSIQFLTISSHNTGFVNWTESYPSRDT